MASPEVATARVAAMLAEVTYDRDTTEVRVAQLTSQIAAERAAVTYDLEVVEATPTKMAERVVVQPAQEESRQHKRVEVVDPTPASVRTFNKKDPPSSSSQGSISPGPSRANSKKATKEAGTSHASTKANGMSSSSSVDSPSPVRNSPASPASDNRTRNAVTDSSSRSRSWKKPQAGARGREIFTTQGHGEPSQRQTNGRGGKWHAERSA